MFLKHEMPKMDDFERKKNFGCEGKILIFYSIFILRKKLELSLEYSYNLNVSGDSLMLIFVFKKIAKLTKIQCKTMISYTV